MMMASKKRRIGSSSSSSSLCSDIVLEILSRLPDKPLFRFMCVSKTWCSLIIDADLRWRRALPLNMVGFFYQSWIFRFLDTSSCMDDQYRHRYDPIDTSLSFLSQYHTRCHIYHSCNGLLLGSYGVEFSAAERLELKLPCYFVCNPATKRWASVPGLLPGSHVVVLAFDPSVSLHFKVYVLHYDHRQGDYTTIRVFSSEDGCWRSLPGVVNDYCFGGMEAVYLNGKVYVAAHTQMLIIDDIKETYELVGLPENISNLMEFYYFGLLGGEEVCIGELFVDDGNLCIWALVTTSDEHGNRHEHAWRLKHSSKVNGVDPGDCKIFGFHKNLDVVFIVDDRKNRVSAYCLQAKTFLWDDFGGLEKRDDGLFPPDAGLPYSPCLVDALDRR